MTTLARMITLATQSEPPSISSPQLLGTVQQPPTQTLSPHVIRKAAVRGESGLALKNFRLLLPPKAQRSPCVPATAPLSLQPLNLFLQLSTTLCYPPDCKRTEMFSCFFRNTLFTKLQVIPSLPRQSSQTSNLLPACGSPHLHLQKPHLASAWVTP